MSVRYTEIVMPLPEAMAFRPSHASESREEAPFAMFMMNFQAQRVPQAYPVYMDEEFLGSLEQVLGVGLRSVSRFS